MSWHLSFSGRFRRRRRLDLRPELFMADHASLANPPTRIFKDRTQVSGAVDEGKTTIPQPARESPRSLIQCQVDDGRYARREQHARITNITDMAKPERVTRNSSQLRSSLHDR